MSWSMGLYSNSPGKGDTVPSPNSWGYTLTDIYDDATELKGDDIVGNIVKVDDNLVH